MKHLSLLFCLFALVLTGCPGEALVGDSCEGHDDCGEGLSCVDGACAEKGASDGNGDGSSDGSTDGAAPTDAGTTDGASASDAGSSGGSVPADAGPGAGSSDGTATTDAGSSDGSTDGVAAVDAGSDEEMTMVDAGGAAAPVADGGTAEPAAEVLCNNAQDDDEDGQVDCGDPDCAADPACTEVGQCTNAMDDDADGFIDCADSDCAADPACAIEECANGMDDDEDGHVDCADPDCDADLACLEDVSTDAGPGEPLSADAGVAVANCSSTDVLALVMGGDAANDTIEGCYTTCMMDLSTPVCVSGCVETGTDLSATCSGCFGELGVCMNAHCLAECGMDPGSDTCETCLEANCSDGFADCAGIDLP